MAGRPTQAQERVWGCRQLNPFLTRAAFVLHSTLHGHRFCCGHFKKVLDTALEAELNSAPETQKTNMVGSILEP